MALPNVASGDPHVAAHNNERALLNSIQSVSDPDFRTSLATRVTTVILPNVVNSTSIDNIVALTQAAYDALGTEDPTTFYLIIEP